MKKDLYLKTILTVIAIALVVLVLQNSGIISTANADIPSHFPYSGLSTNEDGSLNVRIINMGEERMDVNITDIGGYSVRKALPIEPKDNVLDVNIREVDGWNLSSGRIPVETN